ncbi:hypothetical protein B6N60_04155 [Richelia sinica FACHB-800]|uniref:Uncharacterized protein n=1 Tax=Richelia sinica FACHB-800 TaxID=1357546 RepID=A0A975Y6M5_9NOST|nr:hypothetical protein [Richelia sinica]MBD2664879.1 hypothetical protein [Richelia sinica FACHB-800]QXE25440.1 hypothetical protein B6N60_04155 [Richelia sinica FACHB-800]
MFNQKKNPNSDLFHDLSESEQETAGGGFFNSPLTMRYVFLQDTNIYTRGRSLVNISDGNFVGAALNESEYQFNQTTFVMAEFFGGRNRRQNRGSNFLSRIMF